MRIEAVNNRRSVPSLYAEELVNEGILSGEEVENVKISGLTVHNNRVYAAVEMLQPGADQQIGQAFGSGSVVNAGGGNQNLAILDLPQGIPKDPESANVGRYHRLFWKKRF